MREFILTNNKNVSKAAFTLAEVLITLGIIGIVAAMTLPALIQKITIVLLKQDCRNFIPQ